MTMNTLTATTTKLHEKRFLQVPLKRFVFSVVKCVYGIEL